MDRHRQLLLPPPLLLSKMLLLGRAAASCGLARTFVFSISSFITATCFIQVSITRLSKVRGVIRGVWLLVCVSDRLLLSGLRELLHGRATSMPRLGRGCINARLVVLLLVLLLFRRRLAVGTLDLLQLLLLLLMLSLLLLLLVRRLLRGGCCIAA